MQMEAEFYNRILKIVENGTIDDLSGLQALFEKYACSAYTPLLSGLLMANEFYFAEILKSVPKLSVMQLKRLAQDAMDTGSYTKQLILLAYAWNNGYAIAGIGDSPEIIVNKFVVALRKAQTVMEITDKKSAEYKTALAELKELCNRSTMPEEIVISEEN